MNSSLSLTFIYWFYAIAPKKIMGIWENYLVANMHYFSVSLLFKTLFSPWHKDTEDYARGFDIDMFLHVLGLNIASRAIGLVIRGFMIIFALVVELIILILGLFILLVWIALPVVLFLLLTYGISFI